MLFFSYLSILDSLFSAELKEYDIRGNVATRLHYLDLVKFFSTEIPVEEMEKNRQMITIDSTFNFSQATFMTDTVRVGYYTQGLAVGYVTLPFYYFLLYNDFTFWGTVAFLLLLLVVTILFRWQQKWHRIKKMRESRTIVVTKEVEVEKEVLKVVSKILPGEEDKRIRVGNSLLNVLTGELICGGQSLIIAKQPLELLLLLLNSPDKALPKKELYEKMWPLNPDAIGVNGALDKAIFRLRTDLKIDGSISLKSRNGVVRLIF